MAWRSSGRKLSFEILNHSSSHEEKEDQYLVNYQTDPVEKPYRKKKKHKRKHKPLHPAIHEDSITHSYSVVHNSHHTDNGNIQNSYIVGGGGSVVCSTVSEAGAEIQRVYGNGELRQRNVNFAGGVETAVEENASEESGVEEKQRRSEPPNGSVVTKLETAESLDWNKLMADDPNYLFSMEKSPVKYFMDEMNKGISLRSTTTLGSEKERERVYDTIFRLPWRCELLIDVGFFVCLDSFLSLLTIMPTKILMILWRFRSARQFKKPSAAELSDIGCFIVLASGVVLLGQIAQAITLSTCIVAHNNALLALLVSNNFAEIKSNVFKRFSKDNIHSLVYSDSIERFHISAFLSAVLAQNILEAEGPWFESFLLNALMVFFCEMLIDIIKHSFLAKFNDMKPIVYSEFLEELCNQVFNLYIAALFLFEIIEMYVKSPCSSWSGMKLEILMDNVVGFPQGDMDPAVNVWVLTSFFSLFSDFCLCCKLELGDLLVSFVLLQTLNIQTENTDSRKRTLTFIPLAPACVVSTCKYFCTCSCCYGHSLGYPPRYKELTFLKCL
ncbi:hypothetical protein POTOM_035960 [Populus tomentosa]|uniref:Protein POLLEN DEFECTIVE IN GUIDANCE 1 n=1 Tax=Populus tomentosa TaxID=118781 RepID=A0A8X7Z1W0_POPTO|nr:hypothetical protein POTOM_035960 [Populus tomentosa]